MKILVVGRHDVRAALPMAECIDSMAIAMVASTLGAVTMPARQQMQLHDADGQLGWLAGSCANPRTDGIKIMSIRPTNPQHDLPLLQGAILLFDSDTGRPSAIVDAIEVTAIRTAATSGLATSYLARKDASTVSIFGYGVQAASHLDAMLSVRAVERFIIWGRSRDKGEAFCKTHAARLSCPLEFSESAKHAAEMADIICTVTAATEPILRGNWVRPGTHVNLVGSHDARHRECDTDLISRAEVFSDHTPFALAQAGEIVATFDTGATNAPSIKGELGQVVSGEVPGRQNDEEVTVFKSLGLVAQDLLAASLIARNAGANGIGTLTEF